MTSSTSVESTTTLTTTALKPTSPLPTMHNIGFGTYIIILFSATIIVLIWAFFIFFFFSRGGRKTECRNHHQSSSSYRSSASSICSVTTNASFKSDLPPHYDTAVNSKEFPSVLVLDPKMLLEDALPKYQDVVIAGS